MSELPWKSIEVEAAQCRRDVIGISLLTEDCSGKAWDRIADELAAALRRLIYSLDDCRKGSKRKPSAFIPIETSFYETERRYNAIRLYSYGTADLFGITPATLALGRMADLLSVTRDLENLQKQLATMSAGTVLAYERFLKVLLEIPASAHMEWASPSGEQRSYELSVQHAQSASSLINEVTVTEASIQVSGSLTAMNPAKRTFRIVSHDGNCYKGRISDAIRQQCRSENNSIVMPVKVEAVIQRRISFQASIHAESYVDTLIELDTNVGLDVRETLYSLKELYGHLDAFAENDSESVVRPILSLTDYTELATLIEELIGSHPTKGARRMLNTSDIADAQDLLSAGKAISRLVKFSAQMLPTYHDYADEPNVSSTVYAEQKKNSAKLASLLADAYPDCVKLQKLMRKMIKALEDTVKLKD